LRDSSNNILDFADAAARQEGPDKVEWMMHDLRGFTPKTDNQSASIEGFAQGDDLALLGSAGAGKTLIAVYLASQEMVDPGSDVDGIIIVRSAVPGREIGHLKGDEEDKLRWYEEPYSDAFQAVFGKPTSYKHLKNRNKVTFTSTSAKRGVNWRNKVVIIEEIQNMTFQEIDTIMTRRHDDCRLIITGDTRQDDLGYREVSGLPLFEQVVRDVIGFTVVHFTWADCQRGRRVKSWLKATQKVNTKTGEAI
jgi:phosphate starvation-inducible protein PhoH